MARPRKSIDPKKVEALALCGSPPSEIAAWLGVSQDTIENRFSDAVKKGSDIGKRKVRSVLVRQAMNGNTAAAIFLCKAWLGMKEHPDVAINVSATATGNSIVFTEQTKKELEDFYVAMQRRNYNRVRHPEPEKVSANGEPKPALN